MPGYKWTVHRSTNPEGYLSATGIISAGFNRLSTLFVVHRVASGSVEYEVKSAGFGGNAPWLGSMKDGTLARALRGLQSHYKYWAEKYDIHAGDLECGRKGKSL